MIRRIVLWEFHFANDAKLAYAAASTECINQGLLMMVLYMNVKALANGS